MVGVGSLAACSGSDEPSAVIAAPSTTEAPAPAPAGPPLIEVAGEVLAEVPEVGTVASGLARFDELDVTAEEAGPAPERDGVLATGPGLAVTADGSFEGDLQVRLALPDPPSEEAMPVALHRSGDGTVTVEPVLWDPGASQAVLWTDTFSDRWGAWLDPRTWFEEVVQVGEGAVSFVANTITGRTEPPECRDDAPVWASVRTSEAASLHVCLQTSPADDGTERAELYLASNRRTAQVVTVPADRDDLWTDYLSEEARRLVTALAGVDPDTSTVVLGGSKMSLSFQQPVVSSEVELMTYLTTPLAVANPISALLGNLPVGAPLAALAAVASCHAEVSGIDLTRFDLTPAEPARGTELAGQLLTCALDVLAEPELAMGVVREVAGAVGLSDAASLERIDSWLHQIAPTASKVAKGLAVGVALTSVWDAVFDNLADGRATVSLTGSRPPEPEGAAAIRAAAPVEPGGYRGVDWNGTGQLITPQGGAPAVAFSSPSGNIICIWGVEAGLTCGIEQRASAPAEPPGGCGEISWLGNIVGLDAGGAVTDGRCAGGLETPFGARVLPYGQSLSAFGFTCASTEAGVLCMADASGRGFSLARRGLTRF
jgi:hypothetical protein